ncbi:MAG: helix-hairpin-helix domain-containing protein [Anaerolineae bacterium]|nr:helix-hairpin-helix domain-containing protein [Candidatus Roseilinea sp.]MDW8450787.1 helix-hairpin-helix domain-containing protein [Anaerolineae bacterium]
MDITILLLIAALVIGLIIGWLLARGQASGTINELESRVRSAQTAAESAKLDLTNAQSELAVRDSHINTLNANIGILEEKLRLAEQGREEFTVTIARLQDELRTATTDRPAFEAELRQCNAELEELRAQLAKALAEADELRARIAADETEREIAALRAQFAAEAAEEEASRFQSTLTAPVPEAELPETEVIVDETQVQATLAAPVEAAATAAVAAPAANEATQATIAELESRAAQLQNEVLSLRDGLATLAFAGAELVAMYEKRTKEYEDRLAHLQIQPTQITAETAEKQGIGPAGAMGLVAGGAALAAGMQEEDTQTQELQSQLAAIKAELDAVVAGKADLETQLQARTAELEELRAKYDALRADLETETASKAALATQIEAKSAELNDLKLRLSDLEANLDELLGPIEVPEGQPAPDLNAKLGLLKTRVADLDQAKVALAAQVDAGSAELGSLRARLADLEANLDELLGPIEVPEGQPAPDLSAKLGLLKTRVADLDQAKVALAAQVDAGSAELGDLRGRLSDVEAEIDTSLRSQLEVPEGEIPGDLKGKLALFTASLYGLKQARERAEARLQESDAQLAGLNEQLAKLQAELDAANQAKAELTAQIDAKTAELNDLKLNLADLEANLDELLGPIEVPEGQPAPDLSAKLGLLKTRVADLDQTKATLAARVDAESAELGNLRVQISDIEGDIGAWLRTQLEVPEGDMPADLKGKLVLFKSGFYGLKQAKESAEARLQESDARLASLNEQLAKLQGELEAAAQAKAQLEIKLQEKDAEFAKLNDQLAAVQGELEATHRSKADLVAQIDSLSAAKADLEARLDELDKRLKQLEAQEDRRPTLGTAAIAAGAATLGVVAAGAEGEAQTTAQADLAAQLEAKDALIADLNARLEATKNVLQAREAEFGELQAKLEALTAANNELTARLAQAPAPEAVGEDERAALRTQLAELQDRLNAAIAERDALKAELAAKAPAVEAVPDERMTLVREQVKQSKEVAMRAAVEAGGEVRTSECPQDLAMTKGIGSVFEQRLYAAGIGTFWELANLSDDDFKRILELDDRQLLRVDFDAIRTDARRLAVETNSVGRVWQGNEPDDFEPIEGIGSVYERRLYEAGICTYEALANTPIERLMEICPPTKLRKPNYADWIAQARTLAQRKQRGV